MSTRMTVDLPDEINQRLTAIADNHGITKAEAMRRAFALLAVAEDEKKKGNALGIVKEAENGESEVVGRLVGLF